VTAEGTLRVTLPELLSPYAMLVGVLTLAMFATHGAAYLAMKTDGTMQARVVRTLFISWFFYALLYVAASVATYVVSPFLFEGLLVRPHFWIAAGAVMLAILYIPFAVKMKRYGQAFVSSSTAIVIAIGLMGMSLYPRMLPSSIDLEHSLNAYDHSSSPRTLLTMLIITAIGMPFVLGYTIWIYRVFKGKTVVTDDSY
ncbi:MAG: cytochrome d ubiquinol oxidase subunit II, partial [Planctomycetota bacterium]|jgi:cytochrome d ubiquinol oxidase subunit II